MQFDPMAQLAALRHEFGEHGGVNMSIETSTAFTVMKADALPELFSGARGPDTGAYLYGRHFNPTVYALGRQLAAIEGAEAGYGTASGMSAIAAVLLQLCRARDRIVASRTIYGGTYALLKDYLPVRCGIEVELVDCNDLNEVEAALSRGARVLFTESMSNPMLRVPPLRRLADMAHAHGAQLVVDNTFSPLILSPLHHGADVVVHSLTKFINGASDIIAGAICGSEELLASLMDLHQGSLMLLGPTMDPRVAHAISLRLPHLGIRMKEHGARALALASRLETLGVPVVYPGLGSHPDHVLLRELMNPGYGFGGMLCLDMGTAARATVLMEALQNEQCFGYMAVSLGFADTLMSCPALSTSSEMPRETRERAGIREGLVRMSIGITGSLEERWQQLEQALERVERVGRAA